MAQSTYPSTLYVTGRSAPLGLATEIALRVASRVTLTRVKIKRVSGDATTVSPRLVSTSGAAAASQAEEWHCPATPVGSKIDEDNLSVDMRADASGQVYLCLAPDAGTNNIVDYALYFTLAAPS